MADSKAKRDRRKLRREGELDPSIKRLNWNGVNPVQRVKPHKKRIIVEDLRKSDEY